MAQRFHQEGTVSALAAVVGLVLAAVGLTFVFGITRGDDSAAVYLFGILFAVVGLFVFVSHGLKWFSLPGRSRLTSLLYDGANFTDHPMFPKVRVSRSRRGHIELHCEQSRFTRVIGMLVGAALFAGVPIGILIGSGTSGLVERIFLTVFFGIFILVGLILFIAACHGILKILMVGKTHVEISAEPLQPGQKVRVYLYQEGQFPITSARLTLIGEEIARWTESSGAGRNRSSHTVVRTNRFCLAAIAEGTNLRASNSAPILQGDIVIPQHAMHSFSTFPCTIRWGIELHLDIPRRPDVKELHLFRVAPISARRERE
ncbi:MAG: hypothetical protein JJU11_03175 [Candidatus Sumerlaeia bacterium]|nr:hypothetical protein [Candidatus Sumerlaeia bacterium]